MKAPRPNIWIFLAAVNGFVAVAAAALGSHSISGDMAVERLFIYRQGADFHMSHALALLGVGILFNMADAARQRTLGYAGGAFLAGIVLFSGTLYWRGVGGNDSIEPFGFLTPLGGICLLAGWAILSLTTWKVVWRRQE